MTASDTHSDTATTFADSMAAGDVETGIALLADDVIFHSPVVHRPYEGRHAVAAILRAVSVVFEDFGYTGRYDSDDGHVLAFSARVGDRQLEGVDIMRLDAGGRIAELTVMVRPFSATTALRDRMAAALAG
jgi:hypothetical protein